MKNTSTSPKTLPSHASFQELYLKKDYKGAAQYLLDNKQQMDSGIFHYNLGTVYSKMGDQATARFHLEKAIKEGYVNTAALNNLSFIKSELRVDDLTTSTQLPDQLMSTALAIPKTAYISITLLVGLFFILLIRFGKIQKKWLMALVLLISLLPTVFSYTYVERINFAVTLKDVPLYEGPSKIFSEKGKVRAGSKIVLGEFKDGWFYIEFPLSLAGWISKENIGVY